MKRISVLFVCMGNICRSPLAEGIFVHLADQQGVGGDIEADSAGTGGWHEGNSPDPRSVDMAHRHGIDISAQRARQIRVGDFAHFDLILAMDDDNLARLNAACPPQYRHKLHLLGAYASGTGESVPDPYYGGEDGFLAVYNMLFAGCSSLLTKLLGPTS